MAQKAASNQRLGDNIWSKTPRVVSIIIVCIFFVSFTGNITYLFSECGAPHLDVWLFGHAGISFDVFPVR